MSGQAINSIATILKRLEAATSRLEDIAASGGVGSGEGGALPSSASHATIPASASTSGVTAASAPGSAASAAGAASVAAATDPSALVADSPALSAWDDYLDHQLKEYTGLSEKIGGLVAEQAKEVAATFAAQRNLIKLASACAKPAGGSSSPAFANLLGPLQTALMAVTEIREKNRGEKVLFNHLSAVSEGIPAVGWVAVEPKPGPFVSEMKDSAQFYTNRVIKEFKEKDRTHVEWCRSFIKVLDVLKEYIMKHHTTGLSWNPKGIDVAAYNDGASSDAPAAPPAPQAPPPPPAPLGGDVPMAPPPPPANFGSAPAAAGGMDAVFSQLNQGEGITSSLKKVDASQMTHKNPGLRGAGAPSPSASAKPAPPRPGSKPSSLRPKKPAQTALEGNKWNVENHENNREIVIDATELNHTVNIFGCKNCIIQIKGKINAVAMVSCQKTSILLDTLVSSLEITSSPSFAVQVLGRTPTIILDSCDSGQVYLSKDGLDTELITSKCSAINVSVPKQGVDAEEGEFTELALPEQLKFSVAGGSLKSEVVAHTG